ncbi:helix-turn-helix domain-containing protein [Pseudobdellovibrio exovorus]|uniref:HTH cro/C1-type domain-containing protein n=1 Tax=Pseudobdellovibrio exovorus JSS TaxID=1184267 RepID=M4V7N5_9BACT|nr:helix-turn-helix transcriptional regulator [Pseudobdellovibrio exovorus]AGH94450.1 hypothetical protein A11Q_230 [Pseudobdellovibrio exovorus JSS]
MNNWNDESTYRLLKLIGEAVKTRRLQKNISQAELSKLSGISLNSITRFETGKGNITLYSLINILKVLDMTEALESVFSVNRITPSLLAKAVRKNNVQQRVRRTKGKSTRGPWLWEEDKK